MRVRPLFGQQGFAAHSTLLGSSVPAGNVTVDNDSILSSFVRGILELFVVVYNGTKNWYCSTVQNIAKVIESHGKPIVAQHITDAVVCIYGGLSNCGFNPFHCGVYRNGKMLEKNRLGTGCAHQRIRWGFFPTPGVRCSQSGTNYYAEIRG